MIGALNHLSGLAAATAAPASMRDLRYIIQQVEHFSDESLNSALWTAGILIGVITLALGVLAPILINQNATRKFKKKLAKAEKGINAIEGRFREEMEKIRQDIVKTAKIAKADALTTNASNLLPRDAMGKLLMAAEYFVEGGDYLGAERRLSEVSGPDFISRLRCAHPTESSEIHRQFTRQIEGVKNQVRKASDDGGLGSAILPGLIQRAEDLYSKAFDISAKDKQNEEIL